MSAQAASVPIPFTKRQERREWPQAVVASAKVKVPDSVNLEILYQLCCAPLPTEQQLALEEFLLECD
jgi:hypothetical protein